MSTDILRVNLVFFLMVLRNLKSILWNIWVSSFEPSWFMMLPSSSHYTYLDMSGKGALQEKNSIVCKLLCYTKFLSSGNSFNELNSLTMKLMEIIHKIVKSN